MLWHAVASRTNAALGLSEGRTTAANLLCAVPSQLLVLVLAVEQSRNETIMDVACIRGCCTTQTVSTRVTFVTDDINHGRFSYVYMCDRRVDVARGVGDSDIYCISEAQKGSMMQRR